MRVLVIDNYDSFVYNLVHYLEALGADVTVKRNDEFTMEEVADYDKVLLSPGPGLPKDAGLMPELLKTYASSKSILGVCLGHQAIGEAFGGNLENLEEVYHGVDCNLEVIKGDGLFKDLPANVKVGRYHSWVVQKEVPEDLEVTAVDSNGVVMAMRHKEYDITGVQFHPESVLTECGMEMLKNWLGL